jgi:hypothetical protein
MENFIRLFIRIGPGIWVCVRAGEFKGPQGRIQVAVGTTFTMGTNFMGVDVASLLEDEHNKMDGHKSLQETPGTYTQIQRPSPGDAPD